MEKKYPIEYNTKLAILKKHYFDYYRPSFPSDERTTEVVNQALCIKEETEAIFRAMDEYAATPHGAVWVKATTVVPASWHLKCVRFIHTKQPLIDPEKWLNANEKAIEVVEWLDETGQSQQPAREVKP